MGHLHSSCYRAVIGGVCLLALGAVQWCPAQTTAGGSDPSPTASAVSAAAAPAIRLHSGEGASLSGANGETVTVNWSGYAVAAGTYTSAQATWTVPAVNYAPYPGSPSTEQSLTWVGIGGFRTNALVQLGTGQNLDPFSPQPYFAWYELFPATSTVQLGLDFPVQPGDVVTASLSCTASCAPNATQIWALSMTNETEGWTWSNTFNFATALDSAEWIEEAPSLNSVEPLANYGTVAFSGLAANGANPGLSLAANGVVMNDPNGGNSTPCAAAGGNQFVVSYGTTCPAQLLAAVLPGSRSVRVHTAATAFATIINTGAADAAGCAIVPAVAPAAGLPFSFLYQTTDPRTNALTGAPNTPANIPASGSQSFVIALTPTGSFSPADLAFSFACGQAGPAPIEVGLDTLLLSASTGAVPDIVALAASGDPGIVDVPGGNGAGAFAVATVNLGASAAITVSANTGSATLPVTLTVCQTNPASGGCLAAPASRVTTTINAGDTPTFGVFAAGGGAVRFDPANNRVFVEFADSSGRVRGETSVAVRTQ